MIIRKPLRTAYVWTIAMLGLVAVPGLAQADNTKVAIAFTPTAAVAPVFNAQSQGFFAKGGLDTSLLVQDNSVGVVAAVQAGDAQIGSAAAGVFFGAIQHGLDYVALGCQTTFGPGTNVLGVIVRKGVNIKSAKDLVGKRVAVPGINGGTDVTFQEWLHENGVDRSTVTDVEVKYPQQADILRGDTVDAVVTSEPYLTRIVKAGLGTVLTHLNDIKLSVPDSFYFATRDWANANPAAVAAFVNGLKQGVDFANSNPDQSNQNTAAALQEDATVVSAAGKQNFCNGDVTSYLKQLNTVMIGLNLAQDPIDPATVAWKQP